jgi:drug/metabolite transporter (DMT)-like permease
VSGLGPICALLSSVTWAIGTGAYSRLAAVTSPFTVNFTRAAFALPLFVAVVFVSAGGWAGGVAALQAARGEHYAWFLLSMLASYGIGDSLFMWSAQSLGVPGALAIASCYPLWTALAGFFVDGQALSSYQIAGLFITLGGVVGVILSQPGPPRGKVPLSSTQAAAPRPNRTRGVLLATVTSALWACNNFALSHGGRDLPVAVSNSIRMAMAVVMTFAFGRWLMPKAPVFMPGRELRRWGWVFAVEAFGGSYFFMYGLANSTLAVGSTLTSLAPILAVPIAVSLRIERFSYRRTLGIAVVLFGLYLLVLR